MTAKEKAEELWNKYFKKCADSSYPYNMAQECALIAVDEMLESNMTNLHLHQIEYWEEVKQEIELL